jgi:hypothetical protein
MRVCAYVWFFDQGKDRWNWDDFKDANVEKWSEIHKLKKGMMKRECLCSIDIQNLILNPFINPTIEPLSILYELPPLSTTEDMLTYIIDQGKDGWNQDYFKDVYMKKWSEIHNKVKGTMTRECWCSTCMENLILPSKLTPNI